MCHTKIVFITLKELYAEYCGCDSVIQVPYRVLMFLAIGANYSFPVILLQAYYLLVPH